MAFLLQALYGLFQLTHITVLATLPDKGLADEDVTEEGDEQGLTSGQRLAQAMHIDRRDRNIGMAFRQMSDAIFEASQFLRFARERHEDFDHVLRQYVMQRVLYRLSISDYAGQILLKGALLFWVWNPDPGFRALLFPVLRFEPSTSKQAGSTVE